MKIRRGRNVFEVGLGDDGTLDTVIVVRHVRHGWTEEVRFSTEYASVYRDEDTGALTDEGFATLAQEAVDSVDYVDDIGPSFSVGAAEDPDPDPTPQTDKGPSPEVLQRYHEGRLDLLVRIGRKHYPTWDDYVAESIRMGCCRRLPRIPQGIKQGVTLCFLYHDEGDKWKGSIRGFFVVRQIELIVENETQAARLRATTTEVTPVLQQSAIEEGDRLCGNRGVIDALYAVSVDEFNVQWERAVEDSSACELVGPLFIFKNPVQWPGRPSRGFSWVNGADIITQAEGVIPTNADSVCNWTKLGRGIRY